ncbi:MAG: nuclear protein [Caeruleum heppii]|nr:MAG: nuclear protein [Caeruleum heppii]
MARSAHVSSDEDDLYSGTPAPRTYQPRASDIGPTSTSPSPSPAASISSDKENRMSRTSASTRSTSKGRSTMPPPSKLPTPISDPVTTPRAGKRRRLAEPQSMPHPSQIAHERALEEVADTQFYDPDQDMRERRAVRKGLRDLTRDLNDQDSRTDFLAPGSTGLLDTLQKANEYFSSVKQTSDATLDSRLLVSAADLSYKKTAHLTLGDASQGIDVDEFVSKCITFMRHGPTEHAGSTQTSRVSQGRRRRTTVHEDAEENASDADMDEGDALNWEWLGRRACFPNNLRPPVPGFLLGPLSLQKRARAQRVRRERLQRRNPADVVRPEELQAQDLEKVENSNLTKICGRIREVLVRVQSAGEAAVEAEVTDDMSPREIQDVMERHGICDDGGVGFFNFVINPTSFGQTVENLFYVSFLIREGSVGVAKDGNGLPTLHPSKPHKMTEIKKDGLRKHQAIFSIDWRTWEELTRAFGIERPLIPDRGAEEEGGGGRMGVRGWYG